MNKKLVDTIGYGLALWAFGFALGMILFPFVPVAKLGWIIAPIMTIVTIYVAWRRLKNPHEALSYYITVGAVWAVIAIFLDYLILVRGFAAQNFYDADILISYALLFLIPITAGVALSKKQSQRPVRVLAFGAFDPLEESHKEFLRHARALGTHVTVVVAHDSAIRAYKHRDPHAPEQERLRAIKKLPFVDEAMVGRKTADRYHLLGEIEFDIIALGYNQEPSNEEVEKELERFGKYHVQVVRLEQY